MNPVSVVLHINIIFLVTLYRVWCHRLNIDMSNLKKNIWTIQLPKKSLLVVATLLFAACARPASHGDATTPNGLSDATLPEIHVIEKVSPEGPVVDAYDAEMLFNRATNALEKGDYVSAASQYQQLEREFPDSPHLESALYNLGICLDELGQYDEAVTTYHKLLTRFPDTEDLKNIWFRLAASLEALENWDELIAALESLENAGLPLTSIDRVEIRAKKGAALIESDKPGLAKFELEHAVRIFTRDESVSPTAPDYYYSMAQFKLAEITHAEMRRVTLPADDEALGDILEKKCQLLLDSQYLYTEVIRIGHPHWSAAAAYRTGALYRHLWEDMLDAKPPAELSEEEAQVYMEVLRKRIKILLRKAVKQWRRTMKFAERLSLDNAWVVQTQMDLKEIETVLEIEEQVGSDLP